MLLYVMPRERSTNRSLHVHDVQYILAISPDRPRRPGRSQSPGLWRPTQPASPWSAPGCIFWFELTSNELKRVRPEKCLPEKSSARPSPWSAPGTGTEITPLLLPPPCGVSVRGRAMLGYGLPNTI